jgi:hypothetical protein
MGWGRRGGGGGAWGGGWRHRNWYYATGVPGWARAGYAPAWGPPPLWADEPYAGPAPGEELDMLRQQAEWLKQQLDAISQRMDELGDE